jgi:hypothetical protein
MTPAPPPLLPGSPLVSTPTFTQIPNVFLDEHMALLESGELRVLLYITRRTFGFGFHNHPEANLTIQQIAEGLVLKNGTRKDNGTGMDTRTVQRSIKTLVEKGLVRRVMRYDASKHSLPSSYSLVIQGSDDSEGGVPTTPEISQGYAHPGISTTPEFEIEGGISTTPQKERGSEERKPIVVVVDELTSEDLEIVEGEDAYNAIRRALDGEKKIKASAGDKTKLREKLADARLYQLSIDATVPKFAAWVRKQTEKKSIVLLAYNPWLEMMQEPPENGAGTKSLDEDPTPPATGPFQPITRPIPGSNGVTALPKRGNAPPAPPLVDPFEWVDGLPEFAVRWNRVVKSGPPVKIWDRTGWDHANLIACATTKQFTERLDEVLAKCESILAVGNPLSAHLTFAWLIKPGNYAKPINGDLGYAAKPEKIAGREVAPPPKEFPPDFKLKRSTKPYKELGSV